MATIKSHTDLEQSKKLAEILPLESADMRYEACYVSPKEGIIEYESHPHFAKCIENCIPCWSLAALLGVLPKIHKLKPILDLEECSILYSGTDIYVTASNLIDACVKMIEKLHEQKLL